VARKQLGGSTGSMTPNRKLVATLDAVIMDNSMRSARAIFGRRGRRGRHWTADDRQDVITSAANESPREAMSRCIALAISDSLVRAYEMRAANGSSAIDISFPACAHGFARINKNSDSTYRDAEKSRHDARMRRKDIKIDRDIPQCERAISFEDRKQSFREIIRRFLKVSFRGDVYRGVALLLRMKS